MSQLKKILVAVISIFAVSTTWAAGGGSGFGLNAAIGVPFVTQYGLNYKVTDTFSMAAGYNNLTLDVGISSVSLTMPELLFNYHPFSGSFFIGLGAGQETLSVSATDTTTSLTAKVDVTATTAIAKMGWMWGTADKGFWFGMDVSYVSPSGATVTVTAPGVATTSTAYKDVKDAGQQFGESAYTNITFAKFGYLF